MKKILVIEDEETIREEISFWLEHEGYKVISTESGKEGLRLILKEDPDLILCDILLPGMSGKRILLEYQLQVKESPKPFLFVTALSDVHQVREGMNLGADDYITKPFKKDDLIAAIKTRLSKFDKFKNSEVTALNSLRNRIIGHVPHEMRTPLNAILGFSSMLSTHPEDMSIEEIKQMSQTIYDGAQRLNQSIEKYVLYLSLELNQHTIIQTTPISRPEKIVEETSLQVANKYKRFDDLVLDVKGGTAFVSEDHLQRVVSELIENAFKFSLKKSKVLVVGYEKDKTYRIAIKDSGRGMLESEVNQIGAFMQFERDKYEQQGSGLGLIISKKLLEKYGGNLLIKSEKSKYTEVVAIFRSSL